jgi:hypothetical protein
MAAPVYKVNDLVQATWNGGTRLYAARIIAMNDNGKYKINYDDGIVERATTSKATIIGLMPLPPIYTQVDGWRAGNNMSCTFTVDGRTLTAKRLHHEFMIVTIDDFITTAENDHLVTLLAK